MTKNGRTREGASNNPSPWLSQGDIGGDFVAAAKAVAKNGTFIPALGRPPSRPQICDPGTPRRARG